jgi:hypothetical protein
MSGMHPMTASGIRPNETGPDHGFAHDAGQARRAGDRRTAITAARVTASTGGGDIEITLTRVPRDLLVSTDGGNITIVVPAGSTQYHVTASTDGGNVDDSAIPDNTSSTNQITATSGGGDITIREAS